MSDMRKKAAALKYEPGVDAAPSLTAKGKGLVADRIIELARTHGVPVTEDRDMVEILSTLPLYEEIPPQLYRAVAEVLAFIYKISGEMKKEGRR